MGFRKWMIANTVEAPIPPMVRSFSVFLYVLLAVVVVLVFGEVQLLRGGQLLRPESVRRDLLVDGALILQIVSLIALGKGRRLLWLGLLLLSMAALLAYSILHAL